MLFHAPLVVFLFIILSVWGNSVTHRLARRSFCNPLLVWMEEVPPDIVDVYNHDLSFSYE